MRLSDIGGEFAFIDRVTGVSYKDSAIIRGVGDDCAVLDHAPDRYLLLTTDMMVEGSHFSTEWCTPFQIGRKLMEVNVSDIVAMGGSPRWALISLALPTEVQVEFMDEVYRGLYDSAGTHGVALVGGDTTRGGGLVLNLTLAGDVEKDLIRYRSGARPSDRICVTGTLGKSEAGLRLLLAGKAGYLDGYREPRCRTTAEGITIARYAHAMIDVSDGLASEVVHLCDESGTGARIDRDAIPLSHDTREAARVLSGDPYEYALYGGEDFELVFTISEKDIPSLKKDFSDFTEVGEILPSEQGMYLLSEGRRIELKRGYDHFAV